MALTNRQRVEQALELLKTGLLPYVEREMKSVYGAAKWESQAIAALGDRPLFKGGAWDTTALLSVMIGERRRSIYVNPQLGPHAMNTVNIREAKTQLSRLVDRAARGEAFIIVKAGRPLVKVAAVDAPTEPRRLGFLKGEIEVPEDFDRLGEREIAALFGISA